MLVGIAGGPRGHGDGQGARHDRPAQVAWGRGDLVSHRLEDVFTTADRLVVMKHGHIVGTRPVAKTVADEILHMIVAGTDPRRAMPPQASA
jgi:hypothetical protein